MQAFPIGLGPSGFLGEQATLSCIFTQLWFMGIESQLDKGGFPFVPGLSDTSISCPPLWTLEEHTCQFQGGAEQILSGHVTGSALEVVQGEGGGDEDRAAGKCRSLSH